MATTYLSNAIAIKSSFKSLVQLLFGIKPILHKELKILGEVGIFTNNKSQPISKCYRWASPKSAEKYESENESFEK